MENNATKIITYNNLLEDYSEYNAWKSQESFPVRNYPTELLEKIQITEYFFDGVLSNRTSDNFDRLFLLFKQSVRTIVLENENRKFLFITEPAPTNKSKIKSYKGIINSNIIDKSDFISKEFLYKNNTSRFSAFVNCKKEYFNYLFELFLDDTTSFIIESKEDFLNVKSLEKVMSTFDAEKRSHINYIELISNFCKLGDYIYRIGGNSGDEYLSIQKLVKVGNVR